jgi:hypothetical protein
MHFNFVRLLDVLILRSNLLSLLVAVAVINSLCLVYTLLTEFAGLDSSCAMMSGYHIFCPSCCTGYKSYS